MRATTVAGSPAWRAPTGVELCSARLLELVMPDEDLGHFRPGELRRRCDAGGQHLADLRAREKHVVLRRVVRRLAHHDDAIQFLRPGGVVRLEDLDLERARGHPLLEDLLRVERTVEAAGTRVVAAD